MKTRRSSATTVIVVVLLPLAFARGAVVFVDARATPDGDGQSWATAFRTVRAGLNAAAGGDEVWVARGTYVERLNIETGIALYGGFAGSETVLSQRTWNVNSTILDGDRSGTVVALDSGVTGARIDGFTIRNGWRGVYCASSSSSIIINNAIIAHAHGGIICRSGCSAIIANNTIAGNLAESGAGILCEYASPIITNNTIVSNLAKSPYQGGGIHCTAPQATIVNNIVAFNSAGICGPKTLTLRNNCVYRNDQYNYSHSWIDPTADPTGTDGNISVDPKLAGLGYLNLHIQPNSPCRDAGDSQAVQASWTDTDGQPRTQGNNVDIGADESDGTLWPTDPNVIVHVSPQGDDTHDGLSWATPKRTVQAGINAVAEAGGDVWVKAGIYLERIVLPRYTHVYGGFLGTETARTERNRSAHPTILDGEQIESVITATDLGPGTSTIDGFTIRNGAGARFDPRTPVGGGIFCRYASPTIANNTIISNGASAWGRTVVSGGGICCLDCAYPRIENNLIIANSALGGGGIWCSGYSSPTIINNTVVANNGGPLGGGISWSFNSWVRMANTIVAFNSSGLSLPSGYLPYPPSLQNNCVFGNNFSDYYGLPDPTGTWGNISSDPKLADLAFGNAHIQPDSPCKDAGSNEITEADWLDVDGEPRAQGGTVDIGADESDGTIWPSGPNVIVRVSPDGNNGNDGSSWSLAKRTVQAGIAAAAASGGQVWVKTGTYWESIKLLPFAHIYGGFAGTENAEGQRDWKSQPTSLTNNAGGPVVIAELGFRVSTLDGFTIRQGDGGIDCYTGSPTIVNNVVTASRGCGILCGYSGPMIRNNVITANGGREGGGIYCDYGSSPTIVNNTITANTAAIGGGISSRSSFIVLTNNLIAFNSSGVFQDKQQITGGILRLRHNCVYGNPAYNYSGIPDPTVTNGNISADPRLADALYRNLHIQPDSPCRDAGLDADVMPGERDIDGQPRMQGDHPDIGADESDGTIWAPQPYATVRVSPDGDDALDGSSWPLAKRTVQAAIDTASQIGGEVWVKGGTYPERISLAGYTHVYGGFTGTEDLRTQRGWPRCETILDGQQSGPVVIAAVPGFGLCTIEACTVRNGMASGSGALYGGGIHCNVSSPAIVHNKITANSARYSGGGIYCVYASPTIMHNTIEGNISESDGGGIACIYSSPIIAGNAILRNSSKHDGGGICCESSPAIIANNTIVDNAADSDGGGIFCYHSPPPTVVNTIVAFNSSGIYGYGSESLQHNCVYANTAYDYSHLPAPTEGDGNISADPLFASNASPGPDNQWGTADDISWDLRLKRTSPCIDAGYNAGVISGLATDLAGLVRFADDPETADCRWAPDTCGVAPVVDMGAYEFAAGGDLDLDGDVDSNDLAILVACGSGPMVPAAPVCLDADLDSDGDVDGCDFALLQRHYTTPTPPGPILSRTSH